MKTSFKNFVTWNPGKAISIYDIATLSCKPFQRSFSPINITSSFKSTGIFPVNELIFKDYDFSAAYATDLPVTTSSQNINNIGSPSTSNDLADNNIGLSTSSQNINNTDSLPTSNELADNNIELSNDLIQDSQASLSAVLTDIPSSLMNEENPSDYILKILTPEIVRPYPKAGPRKISDRPRVKSTIYTDSPEKNKLLEKQFKSNNKKTHPAKKPKSNKKSKRKEKKNKKKSNLA